MFRFFRLVLQLSPETDQAAYLSFATLAEDTQNPILGWWQPANQCLWHVEDVHLNQSIAVGLAAESEISVPCLPWRAQVKSGTKPRRQKLRPILPCPHTSTPKCFHLLFSEAFSTQKLAAGSTASHHYACLTQAPRCHTQGLLWLLGTASADCLLGQEMILWM